MPKEDDRRAACRIRSVHLAAYSGESNERPKRAISMGRTLDLSSSGVRLEVDTALEEGDVLEFEITIGEKTIQARARVIHVELVEGGLLEVGAEFGGLAKEDEAVLRSLLP